MGLSSNINIGHLYCDSSRLRECIPLRILRCGISFNVTIAEEQYEVVGNRNLELTDGVNSDFLCTADIYEIEVSCL